MQSLIAMIVDRSGSMSGLKADTIRSFNRFVEEQRQVEGEASLCLTLFSDRVDIGDPEPLQDSKPLSEASYVTQGSTALYDAIGATIDRIGKRLADKDIRADKVIVCIITDGAENSSREYTASQIREMVKHQTEKYSWDFIFLGANIDSFAIGRALSIPKDSTFNYAADSKGLATAYSTASYCVTRRRLG